MSVADIRRTSADHGGGGGIGGGSSVGLGLEEKKQLDEIGEQQPQRGKGGDGEETRVGVAGIGITGMQGRARRNGSNEFGGGEWKDNSWEGVNPMHRRCSSMEQTAPDLDSPWHRPGPCSGSGADGGTVNIGVESNDRN